MTESAFRWASLAVSGVTLLVVLVTAGGVLWNAVQIAELSGKVDALTEIVTGHVNAPNLHAGR
ncbi:MAG: hypothetical protein OXH75_18460 [Acidobacteria bacterium]|nr:hypothetical protein [Acidobacteriota bacterium]